MDTNRSDPSVGSSRVNVDTVTPRSIPAILMRHKRARCVSGGENDPSAAKQCVARSSSSRDVDMMDNTVLTQSGACSGQCDGYSESPPHTPTVADSKRVTVGGTTPRSRWRRRLYTAARQKDISDVGERGSRRVPPLPYLPWTQVDHIWDSMKKKDDIYIRSENPLSNHPSIKNHMRSIVVDWLNEVSMHKKLHRETFYLAVEFLDRYLTRTKNLPRSQLQLTGITCLMIAAKLEEIFPPKLEEYVFVTDGAASEDDVIDKELVIMKVLQWDLSPVTAQHWLATYLQLSDMPSFSHDAPVSAEKFVTPRFSPLQFVQMCQLLDLCVMHPGWLRYKYSVLAASVLYHFTGDREQTTRLSGYSWLELSSCVMWMKPFMETVKHYLLSHVPSFDRSCTADDHSMQFQTVNLVTLDEVQQLIEQHDTAMFSSPSSTTIIPNNENDDGRQLSHVLTPPDSGGRVTVSRRHR